MTTAVELADLRLETAGRDELPGAGRELVHGVSLRVEPGELVGLAGESGSGKSLTASSIAGLLPAGVRVRSGTVTVMGRQQNPEAAGREHDVAMIFQNPMTSLNPAHRIGDQIAEAVRIRHRGIGRGAARARAVEILDRVGVDRAVERARQYPFEFSGGMRQRAMIGIAVAREPAVLVADEPTTALDVTVQKEVMDLIDELRREMGLAVLLISHDLGLLSERSDRLYVMYEGELVAQGVTHDLLVKPPHPYVEWLVSCLPERALEHGGMSALPTTGYTA